MVVVPEVTLRSILKDRRESRSNKQTLSVTDTEEVEVVTKHSFVDYSIEFHIITLYCFALRRWWRKL